MTDVYRTPGFACPTCSNGALREFQQRLVCDECNGMLITDDDVVTSVHEIDGSPHDLEVESEQPTTTLCPRCHGPMMASVLRLGTLRIGGALLRCKQDGVWFPREAMTAMFARVSRRGGFRGMGTVGSGSGVGAADRGPSTANSIIGNMPAAHGGMSAAMASIQFGGGVPATSGLAISHWHDRRPRVHTLFVSSHKDRRLGCPSCEETALEYQGDRWTCATCAGSFVENPALEAMIVEMSQQPWDVPVVSGAPGERDCPICATPMIVEVLEAVTIDRCGAHGVWFDDTELQTALQHASGEPAGIGGWLRHLFHRHGKV